jgi:hypothetical protein
MSASPDWYCVNIKRASGGVEDWCRYTFKVDDKYYGFIVLKDRARAWAFEISK